MEMEITSALAQLGAAGLIGWMWLTERRAVGGAGSSARQRCTSGSCRSARAWRC